MLNLKKIRRRIYYYGAYAFSKLILTSPYKFSVGFLSSLLGKIAYYVAIAGDRSARENLKKCFPEKSDEDIKRIVKRIFCLEAKNFFELANFPRMGSKLIRNAAFVENLNRIRESMKRGKGILFASAHTGNWEITEKLTQTATSILEEHIKQYPEQWVWFHDRWKTKPKKVKG
ncbi:MAG: hypothetical protein LBT58_05340 [Endomicrobium sp.]|jgi:KDO2-lipid IV(A) lauroyltransferase|nr:hypothetical protein [Endomicrobium sp.]